METPTTLVPAQEKLSGALAYILFFIPIMMDKKTEFTCFHMKQAFLINLIWFCGTFIPLLGGLLILAALIHALFLGWKAYSGEKFQVSYIYPYADQLIRTLSIESWFTPKK